MPESYDWLNCRNVIQMEGNYKLCYLLSLLLFLEETVSHKRWLECFSGSWELSFHVFFTERTSKICGSLKEKKFKP